MSEDDRTREMSRDPRVPRRPALQASRLWAGGVATAVIAALIAMVGFLIVRVLLQIPYLAPIEGNTIGGWDGAVQLAIAAAIAALAATGLAQLLLVAVPSPMAYFGWIAGLLTAVATVYPLAFSTEPLTVRIATGAIHLVIGMAIISLVTTTVTSASTRT
ncbi:MULTISPECIES: DUF6069 family protein [Pseudonocardia]|uniref:Uncharacterized protein n=2 Tax=Pseudonocardia TaxID=1847 RepID=A0A1Y2MQB0_PSEAH|nr:MULTISPECIES: DUF6069 family protein [Pseudonocardia]OSY37413.1 hypothetical protein BG845_04716 [Pseudonocardia autotrophica]TDN77262.1 hypothetical protein C8E95_6498 [Pseudonocardia autotrophica]BBG01281.1 hypothetical protein Pdca_24900 [Pseudonocardia autotrophica]GEC26008.1 hypothetical protein PSA01_30370 [Pseudonocardia saturnea]